MEEIMWKILRLFIRHFNLFGCEMESQSKYFKEQQSTAEFFDI